MHTCRVTLECAVEVAAKARIASLVCHLKSLHPRRLLESAEARSEAEPCSGVHRITTDRQRTLGSPALAALCSLLRTLLDGPPAAAAAARTFCRDRVFALLGEREGAAEGASGRPGLQAVALRVTPVVAAAMRGAPDARAALQESGLGAFAEARLAGAQALPPVVSALSDAPVRVPACLASLRMVVACFPVCSGAQAAPPGAATAAERAGLARLLQRQLAGERAAGVAAATAKRLQLSGAAGAAATSVGGAAAAPEAESVLAALAVCALAWAWDELAPADREAVARRVRDGLAAAAVALEDAAEAAAGAAAAAAARLASGAGSGAGLEAGGGSAEAVAPDLALAMLRRAGRTGSAHAARAFRAAVTDVEAAVACGAGSSAAANLNPDPVYVAPPTTSGASATLDPKASPGSSGAPLAGAPQDWARSLALLLAAGILATSSPTPVPGPAGAREGAEAVSEALRLMFAAGVLAAIASAAGPGEGMLRFLALLSSTPIRFACHAAVDAQWFYTYSHKGLLFLQLFG